MPTRGHAHSVRSYTSRASVIRCRKEPASGGLGLPVVVIGPKSNNHDRQSPIDPRPALFPHLQHSSTSPAGSHPQQHHTSSSEKRPEGASRAEEKSEPRAKASERKREPEEECDRAREGERERGTGKGEGGGGRGVRAGIATLPVRGSPLARLTDLWHD